VKRSGLTERKRREEGGEKSCCRWNRSGSKMERNPYVWDLQGVHIASTVSEQRQARNL
jgi:hypothetical protein